jgi:hypothetical protein
MDDKGSIESLNGSHSPGYPSFWSGRLTILHGIFILPGLRLTGPYSYLPFHHIVESFGILIAFCTLFYLSLPRTRQGT